MAVAISASLTFVKPRRTEGYACFESDGEDSHKLPGNNTNFTSKDFGPCEIHAEAVQIEHVRVDTFIESFLAIEARRAFRVGGLEVLQGCSAWSLELSCETGWKTGLAGQAGSLSELTGLSLYFFISVNQGLHFFLSVNQGLHFFLSDLSSWRGQEGYQGELFRVHNPKP